MTPTTVHDHIDYLQVLCDSLESDASRGKMDRDLSGRRDRLIAEIRSFSLDKTGEPRIQLNGLMNRLDRLTILSTPSPFATMTTTTTTSSAIVQTPPQPAQETISPINFQFQMDYIGQKVEYFITDISQNTGRNIVGRSIDIRRELNNLLENMHHHGADLAMITSVETKQSEFIQARDAYLLTTPTETTTAIFLDIFAELRNKLRNIDEMKFESLDNLRQGFINLIPRLPPAEAEIAKAISQEIDNLITERYPNELYTEEENIDQYQRDAKCQVAMKYGEKVHNFKYSKPFEIKVKHIIKFFIKEAKLILQPNEYLVMVHCGKAIDDEVLFDSLDHYKHGGIRILLKKRI